VQKIGEVRTPYGGRRAALEPLGLREEGWARTPGSEGGSAAVWTPEFKGRRWLGSSLLGVMEKVL
jgi:hypothetical protein